MSKPTKSTKGVKTLAASVLSQSPSKSLRPSGTLSQVRNASTGHIITRDSRTGKFTNIGNQPVRGVKVTTVFKSASNPSITRETAELAERAVLAAKNKGVKP